jgi:hypothetical protein
MEKGALCGIEVHQGESSDQLVVFISFRRSGSVEEIGDRSLVEEATLGAFYILSRGGDGGGGLYFGAATEEA